MSGDLFTWLRGLRPRDSDHDARMLEQRFWPLALDVWEQVSELDRCPLCGAELPPDDFEGGHLEDCAVGKAFAIAEKERT